MAMHTGEIYKCPDCGCEIEVTKGPRAGAGGDEDPSCCCGSSMEVKTAAAGKR